MKSKECLGLTSLYIVTFCLQGEKWSATKVRIAAVVCQHCRLSCTNLCLPSNSRVCRRVRVLLLSVYNVPISAVSVFVPRLRQRRGHLK